MDESLDHLLTRAQEFGNGGGASLTEFLALVRGRVAMCGDMDTAATNEIRVMTIHGAVAEAPVVVLSDMLCQQQP